MIEDPVPFFREEPEGEEGGLREEEEGDRDGEEPGEMERRLLVGLLLGEPRGDEYGESACSMRPLLS